jgi:hypothetical protein
MNNPTETEKITIGNKYAKQNTKDVEEEKKNFNPYAQNNAPYPDVKFNQNDEELEDFGGQSGNGFEVFDLKGRLPF